MKTHVAVWSLVTLLCLAAPLMAGPIPIGTPSGAGSDGMFGFPGPDFYSSLHSSVLSNSEPSGSKGDGLLAMGSVGSDKIIGGGNPLPPTPAPVPEPSGVMVMFGSGLLGVIGLVRRKLKA